MTSPETGHTTTNLQGFGFETVTPVSAISEAVEKCVEERMKNWPVGAKGLVSKRIVMMLAVLDVIIDGKWRNVRDKEAVSMLENLAERSGLPMHARSNTSGKRSLFTGIFRDLRDIYGIKPTSAVKLVFKDSIYVLLAGKTPEEARKERTKALQDTSLSRVGFGRLRRIDPEDNWQPNFRPWTIKD